MSYLGDFALSQILNTKFLTTAFATGLPSTLGGTPAVSIYKDDGTTESITGVTLGIDFDSRTGLNNVKVDLSSDLTFYAAGHDYQIVLTAGTVAGDSRVGLVIVEFSINNRTALRPATAGRTLVVDAAGLADSNAVKVGPTGAGTAQTAKDLGASSTQTGDSFARLGAPVLASVSADIAAEPSLVWDKLRADHVVSGSFGEGAASVQGNVTGTVAALTANNDKAGYALSTAGIQAIWDRATSFLVTAGSIGKKLADWVIGTSQTGDSFARLGAPVGASISADIAVVGTAAAAVKVKTDNLPATPAAQSDIPSAAANAAGLLDAAAGVETNLTVREALRLMSSALFAKLSGATTTTVVVRDINDTKSRIICTTDSNGNRTAFTYDKS